VLSVGIALALLTSLSWATGNVLMQRTGRLLGGSRAMLWALVVGGALSGMAALAFDRRTAPVTPAVIAWTALAGVAALVAYAGCFYSFSRAKLSLAVPLVSCWALIAGVFSLTLLGERPRHLQLAGAAIVLCGALLVSRGASRDEPAAGDPPLSRRALGAALAAGLAFGIMLPALGQASAGLGAFGTTAAAYAIGVLLAWPLGRLGGADLRFPPRSSWALVLATGVFETLGYVSLTIATRFAPITLLAPVASLASGFTVLAAWLFLRERPPAMALAGAVLASVGIVLLSR
jgi:O-acetylserine/cysteine efflux transporter